MRPLFVVPAPPNRGLYLRVGNVSENFDIQVLAAQGRMERFDEPILPRRTRSGQVEVALVAAVGTARLARTPGVSSK